MNLNEYIHTSKSTDLYFFITKTSEKQIASSKKKNRKRNVIIQTKRTKIVTFN